MAFAVSYFGDLLIGPHSEWSFIQLIMHILGISSIVFLFKRELEQIKFFGIKDYFSSFWNIADFGLILLYLGAFIPLNYIHYSFEEMTIDWETEWKAINLMIIVMTFVRINQSLQIFDSFSFLVQMVQAVFYDLRLFLAYYAMVMVTFGFILMIVFKDPIKDSSGLGPISYIIMSLRIVWGEGSFDIENSEYKVMAWLTYILLMLVGNIVFMNFLIAVVQQSYESCMQRMQSQSLKSQLLMIQSHYLTYSDDVFKDKDLFPPSYVDPKSTDSADGTNDSDKSQQQWQGMVKELKVHSEKLISAATIEIKRNLTKQTHEMEARISNMIMEQQQKK